eukprot:8848508-Pyramimonas_sp.AAC.1
MANAPNNIPYAKAIPGRDCATLARGSTRRPPPPPRRPAARQLRGRPPPDIVIASMSPRSPQQECDLHHQNRAVQRSKPARLRRRLGA